METNKHIYQQLLEAAQNRLPSSYNYRGEEYTTQVAYTPDQGYRSVKEEFDLSGNFTAFSFWFKFKSFPSSRGGFEWKWVDDNFGFNENYTIGNEKETQ